MPMKRKAKGKNDKLNVHMRLPLHVVRILDKAAKSMGVGRNSYLEMIIGLHLASGK